MNNIEFADFEKWAKGFSGSDGGDIGSADSRSIWICAIEWGEGHNAKDLSDIIKSDVSTPPTGYEDAKHNLSYRFNWNVMKILTVFNGRSIKDYKLFAHELKPFTQGSQGYFKMNLYPISFKDTKENRWTEDFEQLTGFKNKYEYIQWCKKERFPVMNSWVDQFKPKLIICFGKSYIEDFKAAFFIS